MILPYIEQQQLWDEFSKGKQAAAQIEIYVCPSNPPPSRRVCRPCPTWPTPATSRTKASRTRGISASPKENPANGIFLDKTRGGSDVTRSRTALPFPGARPGHQRDLRQRCSLTAMEPTNTLMFAEGLNAGVWTGITQPDKKWHYGFCWEDPQAIARRGDQQRLTPLASRQPQYRMINGIRELLPPTTKETRPPIPAFSSSHHPRGINVALCRTAR